MVGKGGNECGCARAAQTKASRRAGRVESEGGLESIYTKGYTFGGEPAS